VAATDTELAAFRAWLTQMLDDNRAQQRAYAGKPEWRADLKISEDQIETTRAVFDRLLPIPEALKDAPTNLRPAKIHRPPTVEEEAAEGQQRERERQAADAERLAVFPWPNLDREKKAATRRGL
jgi:hypothetical protein